MTRGLYAAEIHLFPPSVQGEIDLERIRLIPRAHNPFARGKILVRNYDIYWPNLPGDFSREPLLRQSVLMHEIAHVWQYATGRLTALRYLFWPGNWLYKYSFDPALGIDDYATEKQADLIQDWFLMHNGAAPRHYRGQPPTLAQINTVVPFKWDMSEGELIV